MKKRRLPWHTLLGFMPLATYFIYSTYAWFGIWNPVDIYQDLNTVGSINPLGIMSALLFDARRGLLVFNPVFILCFVGLPLWWSENKETLLLSLGASVPYLIVLITFWGWYGGHAPVGRYLIDVLPVLMPALAYGLYVLSKSAAKYIAGLLILVSLLVTIVQTKMRSGYVLHLEKETAAVFTWFNAHTSIDFSRLFPNFALNGGVIGPHDHLKVAIYYLAIALSLAYGIFYVRAHRGKTTQ